MANFVLPDLFEPVPHPGGVSCFGKRLSVELLEAFGIECSLEVLESEREVEHYGI